MSDEPIYDTQGKHLGNTKEGFTGNVLIYSGSDNVDFSKMSAAEAQQMKGVDKIQDKAITSETRSNIYTHVLKQMKDIDFGKLFNGKVSILD